MKIVFDGQPLLNEGKSGVGFHESGLIYGLQRQYPNERYKIEIFTRKKRAQKYKMLSSYQKKQIEVEECNWFSGTLYRILMSFFPIPYALFFPKKRDITHFFNFIVPFGVRGKKVVTIHDMTFREFPQTVRKKTRFYLEWNLKRSIKRADKIITVSTFSKQEIQKFFKINPEKIAVVPNGVDFQVFRSDYTQDEISRVKRRYGIKHKYFLYLGTLEPRKNLVGLIKAYAYFLHSCQKENKTREQIPLFVIAGQKGWIYEEIFENVKRLQLERWVIFTGYVNDPDVPILMCGAEIFCFPSYYEGFGMPPIEAMACGTPVFTSDNSALAEVVGDAAWKVNPYDIKDMARGLKKLWSDSKIREDYRERGLEHVKQYTWENAAKKLYTVYEKLYKR